MSAVAARDRAIWCGDFAVPGFGFGHLKVQRRAAPPGSFGLRGSTLHFILVCDGFHRGLLGDPRMRLVAVFGPRGLGQRPQGEALEGMLAHAELDVITRSAYSWKYPLSSGRTPELQIGVLHTLAHELAPIASGSGGIELYVILESERGRGYINLDGVPGNNFIVGGELFL